AGNIYQHEAKDINIQNLSGYVNAYLAHENGEDGNASFDALGNIVVDRATKTDGKNAGITLYTDRSGIDTSDQNKVVNTLSALGRKLVYNEAVATEDNPTPEINLDGKVGIAEGLTAGSMAIRLADLDFNKENGEGSLIAGSIHTPDAYVPVMYGSKETAMMKGAKSAMASTAMLWRAENNDLMKRMGDLRLSEGERGLWAKYYGGKYEMDSQNTDFNLKYNAYQLGYDADAGNGWTVGAAVSYNDGDATYGNGRGDLSAYSAGIYGTWKSEDGQYVDIIAKYSKLDNDYKVFNDSGHKLSGDYKTWGTSISAEYGKRFENDNGFYFDPSVELTLGRINGKDYNAHSDYLDSVGVKKDMQVEQDAFNTLVGRVGFRLGQKLDNASYFVKLAAAHEFSGDFDTTFRAVNEPEGRTSIDFGDTWYEAQIGGTAKLSKNSLIYADFERSFGGDVEEKWRVDAG
ncbi:autotransporter outer membrane beta-barrel domain-containing protein, partial [uncultured Phascolarctobacterium sp.]|uniref:autotransporter outer membrane beta-barrel domain-containing protein n=1 Tax=uncultured Phascolarctobacterium sp. TaxID=512296 RepID=UPI0025F824F5